MNIMSSQNVNPNQSYYQVSNNLNSNMQSIVTNHHNSVIDNNLPL